MSTFEYVALCAKGTTKRMGFILFLPQLAQKQTKLKKLFKIPKVFAAQELWSFRTIVAAYLLMKTHSAQKGTPR